MIKLSRHDDEAVRSRHCNPAPGMILEKLGVSHIGSVSTERCRLTSIILKIEAARLAACEKAYPQRVSIEAAAFNMTKSTDERPFTPTSGQIHDVSRSM